MELKLAWSRFIVICLVAVAFLLFLASAADDGSLVTLSAPAVVVISLLIFFGRGWARLRNAASMQRLRTSDAAEIRRILIGPMLPAILWFVLTLVVSISVLLASVLLINKPAT
jgi:hypothetical protein